jgi:nucleotide-binding universal stress UspA family protein
MMTDYSVLVPLDGSRAAEQALAYLDALRSLGESRVLLLSVVDEAEDYRGLSGSEAVDREANMLSTYLREVSSDVQKHLGVTVETKVLRGSPAGRILDEARSLSPDLLVISTHGRTGIGRWRLGSVADKVIRGATCNTLVVGPKTTELNSWLDARIMPPFTAVLVPLDGSALAERALPVARSFVESFGSDLHLVRVVPIPIAADGFGTEAYSADLLDAMVSAARTYLATTAGGIKDGAGVTTDVLIGGAAFRLEDYIKEKGIDLVILTSHGRGGLIRSALGSVTDRLIGGLAPVLVVRPGVSE